jgi:hypothetical protein
MKLCVSWHLNPSQGVPHKSPPLISLCLYMHPSVVDSSRLCINVTAAPNTHAAIEGLLDTSFSVLTLYQREVGD